MFQIKVVEKIKTHFMPDNIFFRKSYQATDDNIIRRMRFACRITKATDTHSEYVILIAFPLQHWLSERASILRYNTLSCFLLRHTKHVNILPGQKVELPITNNVLHVTYVFVNGHYVNGLQFPTNTFCLIPRFEVYKYLFQPRIIEISRCPAKTKP
jgi:hypothetical protein